MSWRRVRACGPPLARLGPPPCCSFLSFTLHALHHPSTSIPTSMPPPPPTHPPNHRPPKPPRATLTTLEEPHAQIERPPLSQGPPQTPPPTPPTPNPPPISPTTPSPDRTEASTGLPRCRPTYLDVWLATDAPCRGWPGGPEARGGLGPPGGASPKKGRSCVEAISTPKSRPDLKLGPKVAHVMLHLGMCRKRCESKWHDEKPPGNIPPLAQ